MRAVYFILAVFLVFRISVHQVHAQVAHETFDQFLPDSAAKNAWVDSVLHSLSLEEQIAQLLMIRTYSNKDRAFYDSISRLIIKYNIGGITFFQGSPQRQAELTNHWQRVAKTPLLVSIDAEWGLGMRLDSVMDFPEQMTLGAMQDNDMIYRMGYQIGEQCRRIGVQMNFAPVMDVNSNRNNPVINFRSFGENPEMVAEKGLAYIRGLQDAGVIATAKHFPGHGDTDSDSHYTLPVVRHSAGHLDSIELYPFRIAVENGVAGVMVAHLYVPAIDSAGNRATSLSKAAVEGWLRDSLGFYGLAVTDALDMKGVTKYFRPGDIELMAFRAGNDILLLPLDVPGSISRIKEAVAGGLVDSSEVARRCKKILEYKYDTGAGQEDVSVQAITKDLNSGENQLLKRQIFEKAVTLVKNDHDLIPLKILDTLKVAAVVIGKEKGSVFSDRLGSYAPVDKFNLPLVPSKSEMNKLLKTLEGFNLIVISFESTSRYVSKNYGISSEAVSFINKIKAQESKMIVDLFANPYALSAFGTADEINALMVSYEDDPVAKDISAQMIFGAIGISGRLPVTASAVFPVGSGLDTKPLDRLKYTVPEELGIASIQLDTLDRLVEYGIHEEAYPGCQVLFALDGKVFYHKNFGYHTYDSVREVKSDDVYDLASLTKILATTPAVMDLSERNIFDIDLPLSQYLPYLRASNKKMAVTREIMAHEARLQAWIPFFRKTIIDYHPNPAIYSDRQKSGFDIPVAEDLFILNSYRDSIFDTIAISELRETKDYKYSDIGFYLLSDAIENLTGEPLDRFVKQRFYNSLGLSTAGYNPLLNFPPERIVPTELDTVFRKQLVHGYVHDPGAAMLGGVSGHAGLFSNSTDVAVMMQMYLQGGSYGGKRYLNERTVEEFTRQQFPLDENRRAIGFDKPYPEYDSLGPVCRSASQSSFGHSGFTGTYTWADPANGLLYVFLSNRVYPDASNRKILEMDLRTDLHQLMYDILHDRNVGDYSGSEVPE